MRIEFQTQMKTSLPPIGAKPVNREALAVVMPGEHWEPTLSEHVAGLVFEVPFRCKPPPSDEAQYLGLVRGKLTAVGFMHHKRSNGKSVWLMRCDCGRYTVRLIANWVKRLQHPDQCGCCAVTRSITHERNNSKTAGLRTARWRQRMADAGFSPQELDLVKTYKLPADDLAWLRATLDSLQTPATTTE